MRTVRNLIVLIVLLVSGGSAAGRSEPLTVRVSPRQGHAPSDVVIRAFIEPDASNRSVSFRLDSPELSAASDLPIDGDGSPRLREVTFRMMPAGFYKVSVILSGTEGERGHIWSDVSLY